MAPEWTDEDEEIEQAEMETDYFGDDDDEPYDPVPWDDDANEGPDYDWDAYPHQCETCGGEIGQSYSTCTCED